MRVVAAPFTTATSLSDAPGEARRRTVADARKRARSTVARAVL
jgi:hypothetical protein